MMTLTQLARTRTEYALVPVGDILWLTVGLLSRKRSAIQIDLANLATSLECRVVAGLEVVLTFPAI